MNATSWHSWSGLPAASAALYVARAPEKTRAVAIVICRPTVPAPVEMYSTARPVTFTPFGDPPDVASPAFVAVPPVIVDPAMSASAVDVFVLTLQMAQMASSSGCVVGDAVVPVFGVVLAVADPLFTIWSGV